MGKVANHRPGDKLGKWSLRERIGGGGNGIVWRAAAPDGSDYALKLLKRTSATNLARFKAEIEALRKVEGLAGVVPLVDEDLPRKAGVGPRWFVMPLAGSFDAFTQGLAPIDIVHAFVFLADTLASLHALEIFHRDIKPANLLSLSDRLCFSDFGLVKYPLREDVTPANHQLGPRFTMAPEMRRDAGAALGGPADVYSFSKTLWIALTGMRLAFDGQYVSSGALGLKRYHQRIFAEPLDRLLSDCTDNDPAARPSMIEVGERLRAWISLERNFERRNLLEWVSIQNRLFPHGSPDRASWRDVNDICRVLQLAADTPSLNHMFFPTGGGMTLRSVTVAAEAGFIALDVGSRTLLKPEVLHFESFGADSRWNYFRLEASRIAPTGIPGAYVWDDGFCEELCEMRPGTYVSEKAWEERSHAGHPLPPEAVHATRYLKGAFVIFSTGSPYNRDPATYDARHQRMNSDQFRRYIDRNAIRSP